LTDEELETLIEMGAEEGALYEGEAEMIQEIMSSATKRQKDCMTPRVDSFMLPDDLANEEAIARLKENVIGASRFMPIRLIKFSESST